MGHLRGFGNLIEEMSSLVQPIFTDVNILFIDPHGSPLAVCGRIHHAAGANNGVQRNDLIQRYSEHLVGVELPVCLMECLMWLVVMMTKSKLFLAENEIYQI